MQNAHFTIQKDNVFETPCKVFKLGLATRSACYRGPKTHLTEGGLNWPKSGLKWLIPSPKRALDYDT